MPVKYSFFLMAILACGSLQAGPCVPGTLFSYEALGTAGCTVGSLTANNFAFSVLGSSGGAVPVTDMQINVTPTFGGLELGALNFASSGFNVSVNGSVQYLIAYDLDPHADIQSMEDILDPPSAVLGLANITTVGCVGAAFVGATCPTSTATVTVFDNNGATQFNNSTDITPSQILGIRNTIDLEAKGGSAGFDSFTNEALVPEPASGLCCGVVLALLAAIRFRRHPA
jgi:hypothetical protein